MFHWSKPLSPSVALLMLYPLEARTAPPPRFLPPNRLPQFRHRTVGSYFSIQANRGTGDSSPGITREVALKVIPKKKVKGNEESVWSEMEVLKGLDHPNVVRVFPPP
jgi:hypothetical protein